MRSRTQLLQIVTSRLVLPWLILAAGCGQKSSSDGQVRTPSDLQFPVSRQIKGTVLWTFASTDSVQGQSDNATALSIDHDNVLLLNGNTVQAINANSGAMLWSIQPSSPYGGAASWGRPTIAKGVAYIPEHEFGAVAAVALDSGKQLWLCEIPEASNRGVAGSPVVVGDKVCVYTTSGQVYAIDAQSGSRLWTVTIDQRSGYSDRAATPIVDDGNLLFGTWSGKIVQVTTATGTSQPLFQGPGTINSELLPILGGGLIFSGPGKNEPNSSARRDQLFCYDKKGNCLWTYPQSFPALDWAPTLDHGTLYFTAVHPRTWMPEQNRYGDDTAWLHAVNAMNGQDAWKRDLGWTGSGDFSGPLVVAGNTLCVGARDTVYGFSKKDGSELWKVSTHGSVEGPPLWDGKRLYVATNRAKLYAIE